MNNTSSTALRQVTEGGCSVDVAQKNHDEGGAAPEGNFTTSHERRLKAVALVSCCHIVATPDRPFAAIAQSGYFRIQTVRPFLTFGLLV